MVWPWKSHGITSALAVGVRQPQSSAQVPGLGECHSHILKGARGVGDTVVTLELSATGYSLLLPLFYLMPKLSHHLACGNVFKLASSD